MNTTVYESTYRLPTKVLQGMTHDNSTASIIPIGDYVRDAQGKTFYNFITRDMHGKNIVLTGGSVVDIDKALSKEIAKKNNALKIGEYTLYDAISLI